MARIEKRMAASVIRWPGRPWLFLYARIVSPAATATAAAATEDPVEAANRNSPWVNTTGERSKKNLKRASSTNFSEFYFVTVGRIWHR